VIASGLTETPLAVFAVLLGLGFGYSLLSAMLQPSMPSKQICWLPAPATIW
jgi:hypothetical protein